MALRGAEVDQAPFGDDEDAATVFELVLLEVGAQDTALDR